MPGNLCQWNRRTCVRARVSSFCRCEKCLCALSAAAVAYWWSGRRVTYSCNTHTRIMQHHHGNTSPDHATEPFIGLVCVCVCVWQGLSFPLCEVVFSVGMLWQLTESEVNYWSYFVCRSPEWFVSRFNTHTLVFIDRIMYMTRFKRNNLSKQKFKFCHHSLTLMSFQTGRTFFLLRKNIFVFFFWPYNESQYRQISSKYYVRISC